MCVSLVRGTEEGSRSRQGYKTVPGHAHSSFESLVNHVFQGGGEKFGLILATSLAMCRREIYKFLWLDVMILSLSLLL